MEVRTPMKGKTEGEEERQRTRGGRGNVQYRIKQNRRQQNNKKKMTTGGRSKVREILNIMKKFSWSKKIGLKNLFLIFAP